MRKKKIRMIRSASRPNEDSSSVNISLLPSFKTKTQTNTNLNKLLSLQNTNIKSYVKINNKNKTNEKGNFIDNKSKSFRNMTYEYI